jgi:hypothetical protein
MWASMGCEGASHRKSRKELDGVHVESAVEFNGLHRSRAHTKCATVLHSMLSHLGV